MEKYKQHFLKNIRKQLKDWEVVSFISHEELYRFLHSMAETAATIGGEEIGTKATELMNGLEDIDKEEWRLESVERYIFDVIQLCYVYDHQEVLGFPKRINEQQKESAVILLIDDDTSFLMYMKEKLEEEADWYVIVVANPQKAASALYDMKPDCVIIDIHMKEKNGLELLEFLNGKLKQQFIPTVIVSVDGGKETRINSYQKGADDFIQKPFDITEFIVRIQRQLDRKKQIHDLLLLDEVTHVYNRKYLNQAYEHLQNERNRSREPYCLAVLDIDHFKKINDTHGHLVGDEILKAFARFLKEETRMNDIVVRFGGEEFIILFPKTNIQEGYEVIDRLRGKFKELSFEGKRTFFCTFSSGIVEVNNVNTLEYWLQLADNALYEVKKKGRNRVQKAESLYSFWPQKALKVAVVDDDPIIRTIIKGILTKLPHQQTVLEVKTFKDGKDFMNSKWHITEEDSCLVILDGIMPNVDGLEVLKWLYSQEQQGLYKVIMLTSRNSKEDVARALQLGADDYMTKPFNLLELETRVGKLMSRMF
ncbi:diguanylate cyclase [Priestia endophytica]|uniref:diguanylate cyclase n=1 Tax=Priestia endophytica TaxID=135735 RepID=UPI00124E12FB|nr:diguanylate cyclase [Priestia endophytica]KAB2491525.1 diguanylate cyclase [Priestia endophytica]